MSILSQAGGETNDTIIYHDKTTFMQNNEELIIFLKKVGDNEYVPINEDESIYKLDVESPKLADNTELTLSQIEALIK